MFIARPTKLFLQYCRSTGEVDELQFNMGRMAMALEIITQIKALEELKFIAGDRARAEAVTALETLLQDCGMYDLAYEMYGRLAEWRRPKFVPYGPHALSPGGTVVSDGDASPQPPGRTSETSS